jgi:hypothetical protein
MYRYAASMIKPIVELPRSFGATGEYTGSVTVPFGTANGLLRDFKNRVCGTKSSPV